MAHSRARKRAFIKRMNAGSIEVRGFETWRYNGITDSLAIAQFKTYCRAKGYYGQLAMLELRKRDKAN